MLCDPDKVIFFVFSSSVVTVLALNFNVWTYRFLICSTIAQPPVELLFGNKLLYESSNE